MGQVFVSATRCMFFFLPFFLMGHFYHIAYYEFQVFISHVPGAHNYVELIYIYILHMILSWRVVKSETDVPIQSFDHKICL